MLITQLPSQSKNPSIMAKKYQVYMVEDSIPPIEFPSNINFTPLPSTVEFDRIVESVTSSLSSTYFKQIEKQK